MEEKVSLGTGIAKELSVTKPVEQFKSLDEIMNNYFDLVKVLEDMKR